MLPGHWASSIHLRPCDKWHVFHCVFIWDDHRAVSCPWQIPPDSQGLVFPIHHRGCEEGPVGTCVIVLRLHLQCASSKHAVCKWTMKCAFYGYVPANRPPYSPSKHNRLTRTYNARSSSKRGPQRERMQTEQPPQAFSLRPALSP